MEALVRSSMVILAKTLWPLPGQSGLHFSRSSNNTPSICSFSLQNPAIQLTSHSPSPNLSYPTEAWTGLESGARGTQGSQPWKTVHVRFELQKRCRYGENFLLVGDDPMLGSWDPARALPLNWSDGHIWTLELDIPVDLPIQYKFILQQNNGKLRWQPGPDRILRTWDTKNTIVIAEDWKKAEYQRVSEERKMNQIANKDSIAGPEEESLIDAKIEPFVVEDANNDA